MDSTTKEIDPDGDVLALLPTPTTTKLRVSSKALSIASPVFRSMFSSRFREGAALASTTDLTEIEFPDDPPQALEAVFNLLHFRHDCVSANVSHDALYEIALVVDKYDLTAALGPWKEVWLRGGAGDGGKGLFVKYMFGDREGFREGCRRAIMHGRGYGGDSDDEGKDRVKEEEGGENGWDCDALPGTVIGMIHILPCYDTRSISACRISAIQSLLSVTAHFRNLYQSLGIRCKSRGSGNNHRALTCDAAILGSLIRHEIAIGIFPVPSSPYKGISVENLALSMKGLRCFVDLSSGHGGCMIVGPVVEMVDGVLANVDRLDIWDQAKGTDGEGEEATQRYAALEWF